MSRFRTILLLIVFALAVASCGGGDGGESTTTTTTSASADGGGATTEPTQPAADTTTTEAATSSTSEATSSTSSTTSSSQAPVDSGDAQERALAKTAAAEAALPNDWSASTTTEMIDTEEPDDFYNLCAGNTEFDTNTINEVSLAIAALEAQGPVDAVTALPEGQASIEARIFESGSIAGEAFAVLEEVMGTEDGRQCLADEFTALMTAEMPPEAEADLTVEELEVDGADVGLRLNLALSAEGFTFDIAVDLAAARQDDATVYGSFFAFGAPFDEDLRNDMFRAALDA